jgi:hypothetical protein
VPGSVKASRWSPKSAMISRRPPRASTPDGIAVDNLEILSALFSSVTVEWVFLTGTQIGPHRGRNADSVTSFQVV